MSAGQIKKNTNTYIKRDEINILNIFNDNSFNLKNSLLLMTIGIWKLL